MTSELEGIAKLDTLVVVEIAAFGNLFKNLREVVPELNI